MHPHLRHRHVPREPAGVVVVAHRLTRVGRGRLAVVRLLDSTRGRDATHHACPVPAFRECALLESLRVACNPHTRGVASELRGRTPTWEGPAPSGAGHPNTEPTDHDLDPTTRIARRC